MKSKKLLIDLGKLKARYSGLGEMSYNFGKNLSENLSTLKNDGVSIYLMVPEEYVGAFGNEVKYVKLNFFLRHFPWLNSKYDAWYAAHQDSGYMPGNKDCKYILTIHDLNVAYHNNKQKAVKRLYEIQQKIDRADLLTANSFFTKREVETKLDLKGKEMKVVYCGCEDFSKMPANKPKSIADTLSFFLHISTITPKKNTKALVEMMKIMPDKTLIIAGSWDTDYAKEIIADIEHFALTNIIRLEKVNNEEKAWLYQNCDALFFPSYLEGFGLPLIEAMYCGKPVFASTCTSLPEIGSDKAFYWPSLDAAAMKKVVEEKMLLLGSNILFAEELKKYAATYNWTKNIIQYIELFRGILKQDEN